MEFSCPEILLGLLIIIISELRIAIIGGGLTGVTLPIALTKISHVKVQVYEANSSISERGAALSLSANALKVILGHQPKFRQRSPYLM